MSKKEKDPQDRTPSSKEPRKLQTLGEAELRLIAGGVLKTRHD